MVMWHKSVVGVASPGLVVVAVSVVGYVLLGFAFHPLARRQRLFVVDLCQTHKHVGYVRIGVGAHCTVCTARTSHAG